MDPDTDPFQAERALRGITSDLVQAAEDLVNNAAEGDLPDRSQFAKLGAVCGMAVCKEEIENYIRYQGGRKQWNIRFAEQVIVSMTPLLEDLEPGTLHAEAWRRYSVYMYRTLVYRKATRDNDDAQPGTEP